MRKRVLSVLLTLVILLSMIPAVEVTAWADTSGYTVDFTYGEITKKVEGGAKNVDLSCLLDTLGISGELRAVQVYDACKEIAFPDNTAENGAGERLFDIVHGTEGWRLNSYRPFSDTFVLVADTQDVSYEILITDPKADPSIYVGQIHDCCVMQGCQYNSADAEGNCKDFVSEDSGKIEILDVYQQGDDIWLKIKGVAASDGQDIGFSCQKYSAGAWESKESNQCFSVRAAAAQLMDDSTTEWFETVQDAIDQCQSGQTVKILVDVTENVTVARGQDVILDLNGHVLCGDGSDSVIINYGTLTVTDSNPSAIHKFAAASDAAWTWNDELESNYETVTGGCITGGTGTEENGITKTYGGGICNGSKYSSKLTVSGGNIVGNTADIGGGIYNNLNCCTTVSNCCIIGNTAAENGGGVYVSATKIQFGCFVAGTRITMADGSYKNIEDVTEGDCVKSFNHETGKYEGKRVYLAYEGENAEHYFTLHFTNGIQLSIYDRHDLFEQSANQYVTISEANYSSFIGKKFYNAASGTWEELLSVTKSDDAKRYYSLYVANTFNCIANDMLSVPDDADAYLRMYTFREDMTADQAALQADIARYGLYSFEECKFIDSSVLYEELNIKYFHILYGKGLFTEEEAAANYNEFFAGSKSERVKKQSALLTKIVNFFCTTAYAGQLAPADPLTIGGNVTITGNTVSGVANNTYLDSGEYIRLTSDATGASVGVTMVSAPGRFTANGNAADKQYFFSDNPLLAVKFVTDHLELLYGYENRTADSASGTDVPNSNNLSSTITRIQVTGKSGVQAGGLAEIAISEKASNTDKNVKLVLTVKEESNAVAVSNSSATDAIVASATDKTVDYFTIDLARYVSAASVTTRTDIVDTGSKVVEVLIPYNTTGKTDIQVYHYHGGAVEQFTETTNGASGTFTIEGTGSSAVIHLFTSKFSTYAVAYTTSAQASKSGKTNAGNKTFFLKNTDEEVTGVYVDGKPIDKRYYTVDGDAVTIHNDYLKTLDKDPHSMEITTADGAMKVATAKTGDPGVILYAATGTMSFFGGALVIRKRKED